MLDIEALQDINRDVVRGHTQLSIKKLLRHGKCVNNLFLLFYFFHCCEKRF